MYLATPNTVGVRDTIASGRLGAMLTPNSWGAINRKASDRFGHIGLDNGCYGGRWIENVWLTWLDRMAPTAGRALFAVVPDRFDPTDLAGNHAATLERWHIYAGEVKVREFPAAFVAQDGCTPDDVPADADVVFIGGSTSYKLSEVAWGVVAASKAHGRPVHVGRVNSLRRLRACHLSGVDTVDGTFLRWPDKNLPRLLRYLDWLDVHKPLSLFGGTASGQACDWIAQALTQDETAE